MKTQQSKATHVRAKGTSPAKLVTKKLGKHPQAKAAVNVSKKNNFVATAAKQKAPSLAQTQVESDGDLFKFIGTGPAECWPYRSAFQAGQNVSLTSNCNVTSQWLANSTNMPEQQAMPERG